MNKSTLNDLADAIHSYYDANYSSNVINDSFASSVNDIHKTKNMSHHENNNENNEESWGDDVEFITEGVLLITISILGFLGNSMSIYVLLRPTVRGSFSKILMGLASFDALFLLCAIATFGLPTVSPSYKTDFFIHVMPITYGLTHTTRVGSVFATVSVTLERFFAIVFPFKDVNRLKKFLIPSTVVFTIIYNIPKFFELTTELDPSTNETVITTTELRRNPYYASGYVFWSKLIITDLIPYVIIIVLNSFIVVKILKSSRFRARIVRNRNESCQINRETDSEEEMRTFEKQRQEHKLGYLLVCISVLFISCQSFKIIPDIYEIMFCRDNYDDCTSTWFITLCVNVSHLMVCFNSSANFVIYLMGGEKFRRVWCETYMCKKGMSSSNGIQRTDAFHMSMISHHTASVRESRLNSSISAPYHFKASDKISSASASNKTLSSLMGGQNIIDSSKIQMGTPLLRQEDSPPRD